MTVCPGCGLEFEDLPYGACDDCLNDLANKQLEEEMWRQYEEEERAAGRI